MPDRRACHKSDTNEQVQRGVSHGLLLCMHAAKHGHATIVTSGATPENFGRLKAVNSGDALARFSLFSTVTFPGITFAISSVSAKF